MTKKDLLSRMEAGAAFGHDLKRRRNPTEMVALDTSDEIERTLAEAEVKAAGALWQREWAATAVRGLRRSARAEALRPRIEAIERTLTARDEEEIGPYRRALADRTFGPEDFRRLLADRQPYEWDAFVLRLFAADRVPERETERPAKMVHYLPSPTEAVLALAGQVGPNDVFYDIGSGLGLVTMLVAFLTGAKVKGVELEPAYHRRAVELAAELGLAVEYLLGDARRVDYGDGTVFYVYDTFRDEILADMIAVLEKERARSIRIVSRGESTKVFAATPWLEETGARLGLTFFVSRR